MKVMEQYIQFDKLLVGIREQKKTLKAQLEEMELRFEKLDRYENQLMDERWEFFENNKKEICRQMVTDDFKSAMFETLKPYSHLYGKEKAV